MGRVEGRVIDQIRRVTVTNCDPNLAEAVERLFAIHLVRSEAYLDAHVRSLSRWPDAARALEILGRSLERCDDEN